MIIFKALKAIFHSLFCLLPRIFRKKTKSMPIYRVKCREKLIAFTFDSKASQGTTEKILNVLARYDVKSTFFLTGEFAKNNPDMVKMIITDGHEIGNHSYTHPNFRKLDALSRREEIFTAHEALETAIGIPPKPYFRPPYGYYNSDTLNAAGEEGYPWSFLWSIETIDWTGISAWFIKLAVLLFARRGAIALMHIEDTAVNTPAALQGIIERLKKRGYKIVTLSALMSGAKK